MSTYRPFSALPPALEAVLQAAAGILMAGVAAIVVLILVLLFGGCRPAGAFIAVAAALLTGAFGSAAAAVRSPRNRAGWAGLSGAFLVLAGLFLFAATQVGATCGDGGPVE